MPHNGGVRCGGQCQRHQREVAGDQVDSEPIDDDKRGWEERPRDDRRDLPKRLGNGGRFVMIPPPARSSNFDASVGCRHLLLRPGCGLRQGAADGPDVP